MYGVRVQGLHPRRMDPAGAGRHQLLSAHSLCRPFTSNFAIFSTIAFTPVCVRERVDQMDLVVRTDEDPVRPTYPM